MRVTAYGPWNAMVHTGITMGIRAVAAFLFSTSLFAADTHYVSLSGGDKSPYTSWPDAATSIQAAVDAASDGDTVVVNNGAYSLTSEIVVSNNITLQSLNGAAATMVDGGGSVRCFLVTNTIEATIQGFTIRRGYSAGDGGGIYFATNGVVSGCVITGNVSDARGGGVFIAADGTVEGCGEIRNNRAAGDGGGICIGGPGTVIGCTTVWSNTAAGPGGMDLGDPRGRLLRQRAGQRGLHRVQFCGTGEPRGLGVLRNRQLGLQHARTRHLRQHVDVVVAGRFGDEEKTLFPRAPAGGVGSVIPVSPWPSSFAFSLLFEWPRRDSLRSSSMVACHL